MHRRAFTLAELLVVILIIAALVAILLPVIARARAQARQVECMSNMRQVTQSLLQYAADSQNYFLPLDSSTAQAGWAAGADSSEVIPALNQYLQSPRVFHCACDPREGKLTYSVSDFLGGSWKDYLHAKRLFDVKYPAITFALIEETDFHPKISNDSGGFVVEPAPSWVWVDAPAALHNNGTCLTFVDGHCEYWPWVDPRTQTLSSQKHLTRTPNNPDLTRLQSVLGVR